jgi:hypothetical protein
MAMDERSDPDKDATPESAAITGGVPAAAEPSPMTRGRGSAAAGSTWLSLLLGVVLILTALIADQDSDPALGMAIAGGALLVIGIASLTGILDAVTLAVLGFAAGVIFTILAFSAGDFRYPQLILLVAGAAMFIASFASLAASRRPGRGDDEPQAGVENV